MCSLSAEPPVSLAPRFPSSRFRLGCKELARLLLFGAISNAPCPQRCRMLNDPEWGSLGNNGPGVDSPPPFEPPLFPNISVKQRQWSEQGGGRWVRRGRYPHSRDLEWLFAKGSQIHLCSVLSGVESKSWECSKHFTVVGLWAWVESTRVCPGGSRLASARLGWPSIIWGMWMRDAWPARGGRGRWPASVRRGTHTHTAHVRLYLRRQMTFLSPRWLGRKTLITSRSPVAFQLPCEKFGNSSSLGINVPHVSVLKKSHGGTTSTKLE